MTRSSFLFFVTTLILSVAVLSVGSAGGGDWPQWRGPERNGVSSETGLPTEWRPDKNVVWKLDMPGRSGSTPIITGDRIFLNVALEDDLELWAVGKSDGSVVWKRNLGAGNYFRRKHNMSSPSPVTDGELVWVMTGTGVVKAFALAGEEKWSRSLQDDYGRFGLNHGYGSSPLLYQGRLYIQVLHGMTTDDPSYVLALDGGSGKTLWRVERPTDAVMESPDSYTTPAIWARSGGRTELVISGGDYVTGHALETGTELWRVGGLNPQKAPMYRIVASPVVAGDTVYVPSRVEPLLALRDVEGQSQPQVAWTLTRATDVPTPAVSDGILYLVTDRGIAAAHDARSGEQIWGEQRLAAGTYSSSPLVADGKVYVTSEDGATTVLRAGRTFEVLAENPLPGYTLSSIAVSDGRLFLRTEQALYCIGG